MHPMNPPLYPPANPKKSRVIAIAIFPVFIFSASFCGRPPSNASRANATGADTSVATPISSLEFLVSELDNGKLRAKIENLVGLPILTDLIALAKPESLVIAKPEIEKEYEIKDITYTAKIEMKRKGADGKEVEGKCSAENVSVGKPVALTCVDASVTPPPTSGFALACKEANIFDDEDDDGVPDEEGGLTEKLVNNVKVAQCVCGHNGRILDEKDSSGKSLFADASGAFNRYEFDKQCWVGALDKTQFKTACDMALTKGRNVSSSQVKELSTDGLKCPCSPSVIVDLVEYVKTHKASINAEAFSDKCVKGQAP